MATLIGRLKSACIACQFAAPHVKRNEGKLPFVHCPECGLVTHSKNGQQASGLLANTRPETGTPGPSAAPPQIPRRSDDIIVTKPATPAEPQAAPPIAQPPVKKASPWATLLDVSK